MPLLLVNTRNHCYSNVAIQILYNNTKVRFLFQHEAFRTTESKLPMPVCEALSVIFKTDGRIPTSTESLRYLVGKKSGSEYFCSGTMEDALDFLITLLKMLKEEIPQDNLQARYIIDDCVGEEKVERFFLNANLEGHCPKCKSMPDILKNELWWMVPNMINTQIPLKLSVLINRYFSSEYMAMKCSNCCPHESNCPVTGVCKMKPVKSIKCLSNAPNQLLIQVNRFIGATGTRIPTVIKADEILEMPAEENGEEVCVQYRLSSIIDHIGNTTKAGHYIAFVKENNCWMKCDDTNITQSSEEELRTSQNYATIYLTTINSKPFPETNRFL